MTGSRSLSNLNKQIQTCSDQLRKKREGYDIIKNKDQPNKIETIYQQIQEIDKQISASTRQTEWFEFASDRTTKVFQKLKYDRLLFIHGQKFLSNQQSH